MSCAEGSRRVVTLEVADGAVEDYTFPTLPVADPVLTVTAAPTPTTQTSVVVSLSADASAFAAAWGVVLVAGGLGATWTVPRSAAAIRCSPVGGDAVFVLAIVET